MFVKSGYPQNQSKLLMRVNKRKKEAQDSDQNGRQQLKFLFKPCFDENEGYEE